MISSNRITTIAFVLMGLAIVWISAMMCFSDGTTVNERKGIKTYSEEHQIALAENDSAAESSSYDDIALTGTTASTTSRNVQIDDGEITIFGGGYYRISGELIDGSIIIDCHDDAPVYLLFDNASITSSDFSALYVKQATKVILSLQDGTQNYLADAGAYQESKQNDAKPDAALYSKDDLTINGSGALYVVGNYADGIKANDDLKIIGSTITVTAVDEGINANNYAYISDSTITVNSGGDGISCEEEGNENGFVVIEHSVLHIVSGDDGVFASSSIYIEASDFEIVSGGGSKNAVMSGGSMGNGMDGGMGGRFDGSRRTMTAPVDDTAKTSAKGIRAGVNLNIVDGSFYVDSADDALHAKENATITGGSYIILSGDDAVHADSNVVLAPSSMDIQTCYEGIEGAYITINSGDIHITSKDDGINALGLNTVGDMQMGMSMHGSNTRTAKTSEEDIYLILNGGDVYIETAGDGFDSNGSAVINGGTLQIYGPENNGNGSIDVGDGGYVLLVNGGTLFAVGSSGMAETPYSTSQQNTLVFLLNETIAAGSEIAITDGDGNAILSATSNKKFNWICMSDKAIVEGNRYTLQINGETVAAVECSGRVTQFGNRSTGKTRQFNKG